MPSAAYFRRQADICVRLSLIASDERVSNRLITMAREYIATSETLERENGTDPPSTVHETASPNADSEPPELGGARDTPGSGAES